MLETAYRENRSGSATRFLQVGKKTLGDTKKAGDDFIGKPRERRGGGRKKKRKEKNRGGKIPHNQAGKAVKGRQPRRSCRETRNFHRILSGGEK